MNISFDFSFLAILYGFFIGVGIILTKLLVKIIIFEINKDKLVSNSFLSSFIRRNILRGLKKRTSVFVYNPSIDKKTINLTDFFNKKIKNQLLFNRRNESFESFRLRYKHNPLQIQDDDLINDLNVQFIYFNPKTLETYGCFIFLSEKTNKVSYYKGRLELLETINLKEDKLD